MHSMGVSWESSMKRTRSGRRFGAALAALALGACSKPREPARPASPPPPPDHARVRDRAREQGIRDHVRRRDSRALPRRHAGRGGRAAAPVLRHRALQPGQLHRDDQRHRARSRDARGLRDLPGVHRNGHRAGRAAHRARLHLPGPRLHDRQPAHGAAPHLEGIHGGHGEGPPARVGHLRPSPRSARPTRPSMPRPTISTRRSTIPSCISTRSSTRASAGRTWWRWTGWSPTCGSPTARPISRSSCPTCVTTATTGRASTASRAGSSSADRFLAHWVPLITHAPAFRDGLLIVVFDEAGGVDASACCDEPSGPNVEHPGIAGPGAGAPGRCCCRRSSSRGPCRTCPTTTTRCCAASRTCSACRIWATPAEPGLASFGADVYRKAAVWTAYSYRNASIGSSSPLAAPARSRRTGRRRR